MRLPYRLVVAAVALSLGILQSASAEVPVRASAVLPPDLEKLVPASRALPPPSQRPPGSLRKVIVQAPNDSPYRRYTAPQHIPIAVIRTLQDSLVLNQIGDAIAANVKNKSVGYAVTIILPDGASTSRSGGFARHAPDSGARPMLATDKITIASSSKTITAAALMHLMNEKNLPLSTPIAGYLPPYWKLGPNISKITFQQLLTHTAGVRGCDITYYTLKSCIQAGVKTADMNIFKYQNTDYALLRIIIPRMEGGLTSPKLDARFAGYEADQNAVQAPYPEAFYSRAYIDYVNTVVFAPIGFPRIYCAPTGASPALSYKGVPTNIYDFTTLGPGDVWGDMTEVCGSQGWELSASQLATFMHELQSGTKIVPASVADTMRTNLIGMYRATADATAANPKPLVYWNHNGYHPAGYNLGEINTVMMYFANGITVAAIFNSPYAPDDNYYPALTSAVASVKP